ncbi:MAG: AAA family ATPase [Candidatus Omnitrophica bacterium]|jgi:chromosome partitioning protein|nr:AAA family ATPase [Candidatus Omnitrophota bacterium]MDD3988022.1 AAA family ATPase [Candidatus Omnitrophota bacterium]MDD4982321.1 AAA family ATPase [Candidatus Omnitrophota bacterium]MDD5665512.1 AAA family ATPase [Candidatus Omnitrophota bacterium]
MRIIAITNQKGGCGKTTTAINLAASLATNNRKVLLIDLDPQSHATLGLNIKAPLSIYNVLSKIAHQKTKLEGIVQNISPDFDIAPSSIVLSTLEQELAGEIGRESRLMDVLRNFRNNYDYILIDCPPNLGILTINAIRASSEVIIPVEASRFSLEGLDQLISIVNLVRDRLNHEVKFKVLVTNFDSRLAHSFKMLERIKADFKDKLFNNIIHVNVKLKEAQNEGTHVFSYDKYCRGAKDYFSLSREIITQEKTPTPALVLEKRMNEILKEQLPRLTEVMFSVFSPEAKDVFLVGEFNNWQINESGRMMQNNGTWSKRINLNTGKYRYRFVIDGNWIEDSSNPLKEVNPYGSVDSLVEIKAK